MPFHWPVVPFVSWLGLLYLFIPVINPLDDDNCPCASRFHPINTDLSTHPPLSQCIRFSLQLPCTPEHTYQVIVACAAVTYIDKRKQRKGGWVDISFRLYISQSSCYYFFLFRIFWLMYDSDCLAALSHRNTDLSVLTSLCVCHTTRWIQNALNRFDRRPMSLAVAFVGTPTIPEYFGYPSLKGVTGINIHVMFGSLCVFEWKWKWQPISIPIRPIHTPGLISNRLGD